MFRAGHDFQVLKPIVRLDPVFMVHVHRRVRNNQQTSIPRDQSMLRNVSGYTRKGVPWAPNLNISVMPEPTLSAVVPCYVGGVSVYLPTRIVLRAPAAYSRAVDAGFDRTDPRWSLASVTGRAGITVPAPSLVVGGAPTACFHYFVAAVHGANWSILSHCLACFHQVGQPGGCLRHLPGPNRLDLIRFRQFRKHDRVLRVTDTAADELSAARN